MNTPQYVALSSMAEFKSIAQKTKLVFFEIYDGEPNPRLQELLGSVSEQELFLRFDVRKDRGFLTSTRTVVDITPPPDREFISKQLSERRGIGSWAKGVFYGIEESEEAFSSFIEKSRDFAF